MIPILYEKTETAFVSNGLGRLRDCIECLVTEERNGVYECDFQYPMDGANFDLIQVGRIIGVTHDESGDIEPFDIVSYERPIEGVVTFHCVHISYRLSYCTVTASGINSLADAFTAFESAEPDMPFSFDTDKTSSGYVAAFDGIPKTVRSIMGGIEGSILDAYGGEYSFNNWSVYLHSARGQLRNFAIRYGVNMLDYEEDYDSQGTYSSVMPYWTDGTDTVLGDRVDSGGATITDRGECVPLDVSDKFESKPTKAQVEAEALAYMNSHNTFYPAQNIKVDFVRLQDMGYENLGSLMQCNLCDTIKVIFPDYNASGTYKIVKTVWDVLSDRYDEMELGELSITLAQALGVGGGSLGGGGGSQPVEPDDYVVEHGTSGIWTYRKWASGIAECWGIHTHSVTSWHAWGSLYESMPATYATYPTGLFTSTPLVMIVNATTTNGICGIELYQGSPSKDQTPNFHFLRPLTGSALTGYANIYAKGRWK